MCGIFGYVGSRTAEPILVEGLRTLEYRGYDSAGIYVPGYGEVKAVGPIDSLAKQITETIQVVSLNEDSQEVYTSEEVTKDVTVREYIFSDKFCVDIFWKDYEDESVLSLYEVFPKHPKHTIS